MNQLLKIGYYLVVARLLRQFYSSFQVADGALVLTKFVFDMAPLVVGAVAIRLQFDDFVIIGDGGLILV